MTLTATNLSVRIGTTPLLQEVSLTLKSGEVLAVVGPNGAGKSTLLKTLCGDITPTTGEVRMADKPLAQWSTVERAKMRAVLPQESFLTFPFRVHEVVLMGRTPHQSAGESAIDYAVATAALDAVACTHLSDRIYTTLSGGERQRVQLARVLAQLWETVDTNNSNPRYLLLDEPTSNLDLAYQHGTLDIVRRFAQSGGAVLVILHDLNLAAQYADQIIVLHAGRVATMGTPTEVLDPTLIERVFEIPVLVTTHPTHGCPLVVPAPHLIEQYQPLERISL